MVVSFVKVDLSSLSVYSTSGDDEVISLRIIHPTSRQARKLSKFPSLDSNLHFPTISDITWVPALSLSLADMMSNKTWATRTKRIASGLYATPTLLCFENKNQRVWLAGDWLSNICQQTVDQSERRKIICQIQGSSNRTKAVKLLKTVQNGQLLHLKVTRGGPGEDIRVPRLRLPYSQRNDLQVSQEHYVVRIFFSLSNLRSYECSALYKFQASSFLNIWGSQPHQFLKNFLNFSEFEPGFW